MNTLRYRLFVLSLFIGTGCITFHAKPLEPQKTATQFESRSLTDPGLQAFIAQNEPSPMPWPPPMWDSRLLTLAGFYYNAELDVARAQWGAARAGIQTAKERPNPTLNLGPEYASNAEPGFSPWVLAVSIDIPIETAGKRGKRIRQAQALAEAARMHVAQTAWFVRSRVLTAYLSVYAARRTQEILQAQTGKLEQNRRLFKNRSLQGYVSPLTLTQAEVLVGRTQLLLADAARQELDGRHALAAALGVPIQALDNVVLSFAGLNQPKILASEVFVPLRDHALLSRPDLLESLATYAAAQAALELEIAKQYPDVHLGPGFNYDQGTRKWGLAASSVLPILNQNQGPIAEATAKREQAAAQFMALQAQVVNDVDRSIADYAAARQKLETANNLLTIHTQQDERLQKLLHPGDLSRLTLFRAQLDLDSTRLVASDALAQFHQAEENLEDALGQTLPGTIGGPPNLEKNSRLMHEEASHAQ